MPNILGTLEIAKRALSAQQAALSTTGHNIANVNTPGFTRQEPLLRATEYIDAMAGQIGSGAMFERVLRRRDAFLDILYREQNAHLGRLERLEELFGIIENVLNEPSENGLSQSIDDFFEAFHDLANDPEATPARASLRQQGVRLAAGFNRVYTQLRQLQIDVNGEIEVMVRQINDFAGQIAQLNGRIMTLEAADKNASDYRDRRDRLLDRLSKMADLEFAEEPDGAVTVVLAGRSLVEKVRSNELETFVEPRQGIDLVYVRQKSTFEPIEFRSGDLAGIFEIRDQAIPEYLDRLDTLARDLAQQVNFIHRKSFGLNGSTGVSFFKQDTTGAQDLALASEIMTDLSLIAASDTPAPGGNRAALDMAQLRDARIIDDTSSLKDVYNSLVTTIGAMSQDTQRTKNTQDLLVVGIDNERQVVSGVSLNEEVSNLIQYEHAFAAAARVIRTVDDMIQTLLNNL